MRKPWSPSNVRAVLAAPKWAWARPGVAHRRTPLLILTLLIAAFALAYPGVLYLLTQSGALPAGAVLAVLTLCALTVGVAIATLAFGRARRDGTTEAQAGTLSEFAESIRDALVRYDVNGAAIFLSRSSATLLGCQRFELDGNGLIERVHVMDRPAYMAAVSDATARGLHRTVEVRMRRDTGRPGASASYIWVEVSLSPVIGPSPDERSREAIGILRDISDRKDNHSALERARHEAEQASEAKSRFLATLGHELRTPLNAIIGFSDMMRSGVGGTLAPGHQEYVSHIKDSGHHLLEVVNMLLDMSRIEAGKFEIASGLFAPSRLIDPCLQLVSKAAADRAVTITVSVSQNLPQILGDERACRQVLINLLSNAAKFSHEGGEVHLSMARQGRMLAIAVRDDGVGMEADTINRIGEPFLQEQSGLSRRYEGTGLGLSIVKGLVNLHDGQLHVQSEPEQGTTVTVLLPIDGPERMRGPASAEITEFRTDKRSDDEVKWLEDEKRSAAK